MVSSRDPTALKDVQRELLASGVKAAEWEAVDGSDAAAVFAAADQLERRLPKSRDIGGGMYG
ncbi:hypothetical protein MTX20_05770 [Bradyrhizobium sp. ISRA435]|nr:hypothetical protein MTX20_05770 [Bradyrhizobium sp. ISRA435]